MLSGAAGALLLSAGAAMAQTQTLPPTNNQTAPSNENTTDQTRRANQTKQDTGAASASAIETVTVTAEHRSDALQNLAIAASVYTDERRNLVGIEDEADIVNFTPSMSLNGQFLSLRGVGRYTDELGTDSGVAVLVDGIYTPSPDYLNQPDFFTDRIEVLRGPQGTLGGQNDIGGTVNVVEKRPTDDFHEELWYIVNNYENQVVNASISGPVTDDKTLLFRIADSFDWQPTGDGFVKNLANKIYPGSGTSNLLEGQLEWKPSSHFDVWLKVQNFAADNAATYGVNPDKYPIYPPNPFLGFANCPTINTVILQCLAPAPGDLQTTPNPESKNPWVVDDNVSGYVKERNDWTYTTQVNWELPGVTAEYIGGYSQYDYLYDSDLDGTPSGAQGTPPLPPGFLSQIVTGQQAEQWYQNEIDLKSTDDSRLKWLVGAFQYSNYYDAPYYNEEPNNPTLSNVPGAPPNPERAYYNQLGKLLSNTQAVYGNVDYKLTDELTLTGGLRYNWDQKRGTVSYTEFFDTAGIFYCPTTCAPTYLGTVYESAKISESDWTGKLGLEWQADPNTLAYVTVAKGYKSGGMGLLDISPVPVVGPETLYDYETGIKKSFWDQLVVNADVYYYDYHNLQQFLSVENPATSIVSSELVSAQRARTYGFELESVWSPTDDFNLTFNYSYLNARFTEFSLPNGQPIIDFSQLAPGCIGTGTATQPGQCNGVAHANLNGNTIPQSPANKVTVNPVYTMHFDFGDVTGSATYAWIDSQYYGVFNNSNFLAPSYYNLDLRLLYQPPEGHWTLILFARNVTDQLQIINYSTGAFQYGPPNLVTAPAAYPSRGQVTYFDNPPRTFGLELQVRL